jgi:hypothetical protein
VFDCLFPLDCSSNIIVALVMDKHLQAVPFREPVNETFSVLVSTARQIAGNPDVKRAIAPVRHDINPAAHESSSQLSADKSNPGSRPSAWLNADFLALWIRARPGLDPGISCGHPRLAFRRAAGKKDVDGRDKPGHDVER